MTRFFRIALLLLVACDDDPREPNPDSDAGPPDASDAGRDGSTLPMNTRMDSGTFFNDAGVECCIPSPQPSCCMNYGGAKQRVDGCGFVCDGMPSPADPAWRLVPDKWGCPAWSSRGATGACCGSRPPAADASMPASYMCYPDRALFSE